MDSKDVIKQMEGDAEFAKTLEEALRRNAGKEEVGNILAEAGIDADVADDLLAECQRKRGADISFEDLDSETLRMVAGGGIGAPDKLGACSKDYYREECTATVENGSWCGSNDACMLWSSRYHYIDEE